MNMLMKIIMITIMITMMITMMMYDYKDSYCYDFHFSNINSGYQRSMAKHGIKSGGLLGATGERLKVGGEGDEATGPKQHTFVQRSWMYDTSSMKYYQQKRGVSPCTLNGSCVELCVGACVLRMSKRYLYIYSWYMVWVGSLNGHYQSTNHSINQPFNQSNIIQSINLFTHMISYRFLLSPPLAQNGVPDYNLPGWMLKGLGTQVIDDVYNNGKSFTRSNDTIKDNLGIWRG
jgi:hypothetical protein